MKNLKLMMITLMLSLFALVSFGQTNFVGKDVNLYLNSTVKPAEREYDGQEKHLYNRASSE
jgi:hypothetical protein